MIRFTLLTCLIAFAAASQVFAQQPMEDVVHLKNGGIVRGIIIEQILGESLKIQTRDGNVFVFAMDEITRLSKDFAVDTSSSASIKAEIGTLIGLTHLRGPEYYDPWFGRGDRLTATHVRLPSALSVWLIPTEMMAIGAEILFEADDSTHSDADADVLLTGKVAFSPLHASPISIYALGIGSLQYVYESDISAGIGMGLRARIGSALVLRMEGRYERWFEDEVNQFSLLLGLGTQLGG